jgi:Mg-chelatase subunit ChlD
LPTTLTPRYSPGISLNQFTENIEAEISGKGWGEPTDQVPDARAITPYMREGNGGPQLTFNATLNTGLTLNSVTSRNHRVNWSESTGNYLVTFNQSNIKMDRDIWLEWQPSPSSAPQAAIFTELKGQHDYALVMLMPPQVKSQDLQDFDRDITFVIDTSGSMGGRPIVDAKESLQLAIDRLSEKDRFNVVAFNNDTTRLFETSVEGTTRNKQYAKGLCKGG